MDLFTNKGINGRSMFLATSGSCGDPLSSCNEDKEETKTSNTGDNDFKV